MDIIKLAIDQNVIPALSHALISIRNYTASIVLEAQVMRCASKNIRYGNL